MTRVIAGTAGGRRLAVPPGNGTRPTSDRAREGLFSTWGAFLGTLDGARVADLYAGLAPSASKRSPGAPPTPSSSRPSRAPRGPSARTSPRSACPAPNSAPAKRNRS